MNDRRIEDLSAIMKQRPKGLPDLMQQPESSTQAPKPRSDSSSAAAPAVALPPKKRERVASKPRRKAIETRPRVAVRVPADLREFIRAQEHLLGLPLGTTVLQMLEAAHLSGELQVYVEAADKAPATTPGGLFSGVTPSREAVPSTLAAFHLSAENLAVVDRMVQEYAAKDRTALLLSAVRHQRDQSQR